MKAFLVLPVIPDVRMTFAARVILAIASAATEVVQHDSAYTRGPQRDWCSR